MNYSTVYVGMDVHKETFSLCCYTNEKEKAEYPQKVEGHYSKVLNYLEAMRFHYGDDAIFICGYEAGCLGFVLYHQLTSHGVKCVILAPTTMLKPQGKKKVKTDKRDAALIARCLAHHDYSAVHIPTDKDEQVKDYLRMRSDFKSDLKRTKQRIISFCTRHGYRYDDGANYWTQKHVAWLRALKPDAMYGEALEEYMLAYDHLVDKIERIDRRIEEIASEDGYRDKVRKLSCFIGVKTQTALSVVAETGDFRRFATAQHYASFLGLTPGEDSSGEGQTRLGITKAGNSHLRTLLVESAQSFARGQVGYKSKALKARQKGCPPAAVAYADRANERLRRRYYRLTMKNGKRANVAKTAIARELACFIWGMMTEDIA